MSTTETQNLVILCEKVLKRLDSIPVAGKLYCYQLEMKKQLPKVKEEIGMEVPNGN